MTYFKRLLNRGTLLAIVSGLIVIAQALGFSFDSEAVMLIINAICGILITLGIMNNPETKGIDLPNKEGE